MTSNDLTSNETTHDELTHDSTTPETSAAEATAPEVNPCLREIEAEVAAEAVSREWKAAVAHIQKHAKIPGFRQGKLPESLVRSKFAEDIKTAVLEKLVPPAFHAEAEKQNLMPLNQPQMVELEIEEERPLRFKAIFEVMPVFTVEGYQEIKATIEMVAASEEDVDKMVANLREQTATYTNVEEERELREGDFASASFKSTSEEENAEPVTMDDVLVEIGGEKTVAEFTENLKGTKAGETRTFTVKYADDHDDQRLAGKTLHYEVTVKGIKNKVVSELNDEWVKELGQEEIQSLEQLRAQIRKGMEEEKQHAAEHKAKDDIVRQLLEKFPIAVPQTLVEDALQQRLEQGLRHMAMQGMPMEYLQRLDVRKLRETQRPAAVRDVQVNLLLSKIAEAQGIEISDEAMNEEFAKAAAQSRQSATELRKKMEENHAIENLRMQMRCDRALNWFVHREG